MGHEISEADVDTLEEVLHAVPTVEAGSKLRALLERLGRLDKPPAEPTPGMILLDHARSQGTPPEVRAAVLRVLEPAYNVVEYDGLARVEAERGDASHVAHAEAQRAKWTRALDEALGPVLDEFVELARERDHGPTPEALPATPDDFGGDDSESHYAAPAVMAALRKVRKARETVQTTGEPAITAQQVRVEEAKAVPIGVSVAVAVEADTTIEPPKPEPISLGALDGVLTEEEAQLARAIARLTGFVPVLQFRYEGDRRVDCQLMYRFVAQWDEKRQWRERVVTAPENIRPTERTVWCLREAARCVRLEHRRDV